MAIITIITNITRGETVGNIIQMDTREKTGKKDRILRYFDQHGIRYIRSKLYCGDYTRLDDQTVCIDTKQGLSEVYSNVIGDHERFKAECLRAADAGIRLVILIEQPGIMDLDQIQWWVNPRIFRKRAKGQRSPADSVTLEKIMRTMADRYGVEWQFCDPEKTGERICQILRIDGR